MLKGAKAFLLFAAMVFIPIVADNFLHAKPDVPLGLGLGSEWALEVLVLAAALIAGLYWYWLTSNRLEFIESCLRRAERDLNNLLKSANEHGGRKEKAGERLGWSRMIRAPGVQVFGDGYRSPVHDLIDANEKDLAAKGSVTAKAGTTAMLLRELCEGSVGTAQSRVLAEFINGGTLPYVSPGIAELIGFNQFDQETGFPAGAGVDSDELEWVVKRVGFPTEDLISVKTNAEGKKTERRGKEVLLDLTRQEPLD